MPDDTLDPIVTLGPAGTPGFLANGDLVVLERRWETTIDQKGTRDGRILAHRYTAGDWEKDAEVVIKGVKGSPVGCAVSPDGAAIAVGAKTVKLLTWPDGKKIASLKGIKYQLERWSIGFSPSGELLAVADGGYVKPRNRWLRVFSARDGAELAKIETETFCVWQALMPDDETVVTWSLRHDFEYQSKTEPQYLISCFDVMSGELRWMRRFWSKPHRVSYEPSTGRLWTTGEHITSSEGQTSATTRNLEALSMRDGTTAATVELPPLAFPDGTLAATPRRVVTRWRAGAAGPGGVFAVDPDDGRRTRLVGAGGVYAAADPSRGLVALSSVKAGTVLFDLSG